jgi:AraC family transcriptional regulator, ethanolamine operon transcriptional activator
VSNQTEGIAVDASGSEHSFDDIDLFANALVSAEGKYIRTGRSTHAWSIASAEVHRIRLQQVNVGGPAIFSGVGAAQSFTISFPWPKAAPIQINGSPLDDDAFCLLCEGRGVTYCSPSRTSWLAVTIPTAFNRATAAASDHMQRCVEQGGRLACLEGAALPRIRKLISSVLSVDDGATSTASLHMAQEIADAALFVLWGARPVAGYHPGRREQPRAPILRRCLQVLAQHEAAPLTLMELCDSAEVPERTLRKVFYEYFGVSPMRLLKLRQLNETNRRLTRGSSA